MGLGVGSGLVPSNYNYYNKYIVSPWVKGGEALPKILHVTININRNLLFESVSTKCGINY